MVTCWLNFLFKMQFLRVNRRKKQRFFPAEPFFLVLYMIVYQSALIPSKLPCPKKFLVTHQCWDFCGSLGWDFFFEFFKNYLRTSFSREHLRWLLLGSNSSIEYCLENLDCCSCFACRVVAKLAGKWGGG